jgi:hypothetical protein
MILPSWILSATSVKATDQSSAEGGSGAGGSGGKAGKDKSKSISLCFTLGFMH